MLCRSAYRGRKTPSRHGDRSIDDLPGGMIFGCRKRATPQAFAGAFSENRSLLPEGNYLICRLSRYRAKLSMRTPPRS